MTADKAFGSMTTAPVLDRSKRSGAWTLWETLARGRPEFGDPSVFDDHVDESVWESFTVTSSDPLFLNLMQDFTGSVPGRGGLVTFKESNWLITLSIFQQPFFANQPADVSVWWGYGLYYDRPGNFVNKPMGDCTGAEILTEVLGHLQFDQDKAAILASSNVIPCVMPYITSQFLVRKAGDRPDVVPKGSKNLAFLGQYSEQPDDVVFTVEYSVRSAQTAVYSLLKVTDKKVPAMYKGLHDPRVVFAALQTLHR
jgi:oleate hydratase